MAKKPTSAQKNRKRLKVITGGKKATNPFYKRWQFYVTGLFFGVVGVVLVLFLNATTTPTNCRSLASSGNTVKFCVTALPAYNSLRATADYVAADTKSTMTSGTISLELCSPQTLLCTVAGTSSQVLLYTNSQPRYQYLYTQGTRFLRGALYRACFTMNTKAGWNIKRECTGILDYGTSQNNAPTLYSRTAQYSTSASPTSLASNDPACNSPQLKKPDGSPYTCVFDEEFNGTSLDTAKWTPLTAAATGVGQGQDCFVDSPNNISVSGGVLNLTSRKEDKQFTCWGRKIAPTTPSIVTSGNVTTGRKFSMQYGRVEIRAKIPDVQPNTPGLMQSLWLWPDKPYDQNPGGDPWPATGEIDIVEMFSVGSDRAIPYIHYVPDPADPNVTNPYCYIDRSQYHTYILTWTADTIQIDIDNYTCLIDKPRPKAPQTHPQPFNKTFYISLSSGLGVRGSANDFVDGRTPLPATTHIDYVRVWK